MPRILTAPAASGTLVRSGDGLRSDVARRSVTSGGKSHRWQPPEGVTPDDALAVIAAATCERDRLLLRCLWATGGRINEVLPLRPCDVRRDSLILKNEKNPGRLVKQVYLSSGDADLPGELLLFAQEQRTAPDGPLFASRVHAGGRRPLSDVQAWRIVKAASRRAGVAVLALRDSADGPKGAPAPLHPHLFRHARARHILRETKSLPLVQREMGWSTLVMAYLSIGDEEARRMIGDIP